MTREMCPHTYDMVCINEWGDDSDDVECKDCPHYNGGKDIYGLQDEDSPIVVEEREERREIREHGVILVIDKEGFTFYDETTGKFLYVMNEHQIEVLKEGA